MFPAGFLTATVLAFIMLGDAVREAFDPRLQMTPAPDAPPHLLDLQRSLRRVPHARRRRARLNGVSFHVDAGETLALLGESGSGKSVTAQAIMGILDSPPAAVRRGASCTRAAICSTLPRTSGAICAGAQLAMVFQDALSALNPVFPVGWQIAEALRVREGLSRTAALAARRGADGTRARFRRRAPV